MKRFLLGVLAMSVACLVSPPAIFAQSIYPGSSFTGTMTQDLSSKSASVGQRVVLTNVTSSSGSITGARMYGTVTGVTHSGIGRRGSVAIAFSRLVLASGASYAIAGRVTNLTTNKKGNVTNEVAGAVLGDIAGNYLGKHLGTNLGGLAGAAGGYLYARNNLTDIVVPAGSAVTVQVSVARRQAGR